MPSLSVKKIVMRRINPAVSGRSIKTCRKQESGNVFLFILIGIVLFAAITYVMSSSMSSQGTSRLSARQADLAVSEVMDFTRKLERAVNTMRRNGISESDISFENGGSFVNASCNDASDQNFPACQIFNPLGAGLSMQDIPPNINDGSAWHFTGRTCIEGGSATGCDTDGVSNEELLAVLPNLDEQVCTLINQRLNITSIPADTGGGYSSSAFTGTYSDDSEIILAGGPYSSACFSRLGSFHFYTLLIQR
jgi:hypothetical protein